MAVYGERSARTTSYTTFIRPVCHRATPPTPPHSDDEQALQGSHELPPAQLPSYVPVPLTPPDSVRGSLDLHVESLHDSHVADSQNVLDRVKQFLKVKPAESLVNMMPY